MDDFTGLLEGPRARGAFLLRAVMDPPWCVRVEDRAPISLVAVVRGSAWVIPDTGDSVRLGPGDVAILRGPEPYAFADAPDTPPHVLVHPGQGCTTLTGEDLAEVMAQGVRTWGDSAMGETALLIGTYEEIGEPGQRLLATLPPLLVLRTDDWDSPLVQLLANEVIKDVPGQDVVLDRLLDLLVVAVVRAWLEEADAEDVPWYRAHRDPVVGPALRLLQNNPAHPWTVAGLAAETGVSRATMARRFTELVGEAPMTFLTEWRLAVAADLLLEPGTTIGAVAQQVGYGSAFALSAAFKRARGVSPSEHRALDRTRSLRLA